MKREDIYGYFENILWIILIIIFLLAIGYYINHITNTTGYINNPSYLSHIQYISPQKNVDNQNSYTLSNSPHKLVNLYKEDYKVIRNKNDIECVNRDSILLYDDKYNTDNDNFDVELMRPYYKNNNFVKELEEVYNTKISSPENDEIFNNSLREQKTDLPLANIPVYALLDNKPLKLSDRKYSDLQ